ncbi:hypothetical protein QO021_28340 (plasmid) [Pseudomonas amygdali pv. lachrymans]|uniref:hypothetical protein n=1 Tax=Pseudomonas amygdali TaxID=47877 RepID=UPI0006B8A38B|nr:hypothetical protein [Pseudomonas amygdali]RMM39396.1 hypothetical protein ALQ79_200312 [Pseudomonas amygdali pv. lachrymans]WIO61468.1 hypothetical protein QO021_28340 [Pseudomonas amygdali pv. lachrymans]
MANEKLIARINDIAASLNKRQQAYLVVAYEHDQSAEEANSGPSARAAANWRWIEYGPDGRVRKLTYDGPLRKSLEAMGLVGHGTGSTWGSLEKRGLILTERRLIGLGSIQSLFVRLTTEGRRVARAVQGLAIVKPRYVAPDKPFSITALRILHLGQQFPDKSFDSFQPWIGRTSYPDPMIVLGVARGLVKKGLLQVSGHKARFQITPAGQSIDIEAEENWKPFKCPAAGEPGWVNLILD